MQSRDLKFKILKLIFCLENSGGLKINRCAMLFYYTFHFLTNRTPADILLVKLKLSSKGYPYGWLFKKTFTSTKINL